MSGPDDRDLSTAFEELTAPPSTANYATRTPGLEIRTSARRWPQALATALAVLVAVAGAGTFLALRSARQGGAPSSSAGAPPARSGAAMAYDSSAGVTVMFGGSDAAGRPRTDTWTWNGSAWTAAAGGPGSLVDVRMVDDPADGGVLLVGTRATPVSGSAGSTGSGCAGGGSGSAGSAPGGTPVDDIPAPAIATAPPDGTPVPGGPLPTSPTVICPPIAVTPIAPTSTEQTWLFGGGGWRLAATSTSDSTPPAGAQLAFDSTTRQVVAVTSSSFVCDLPIGEFATDGSFACPALGASSSSSSAPSIVCAPSGGCPGSGAISTWAWSRGDWQKEPADAALQPGLDTFLFDDPATQHATLVTQLALGAVPEVAPACVPSGASCALSTVPTVTTWTWSGSGWTRTSQVTNNQQAPNLAGATIASVDGSLVALTSDGQTWTRAAGQWTQASAGAHPTARSGAAMAQGPSGTVVLFGGAADSGLTVSSSGASVGSDTWRWNGSTWQHVGGAAPSAPPVPSCLAEKDNRQTPPCVQPLPAEVPPVAPQATP